MTENLGLVSRQWIFLRTFSALVQWADQRGYVLTAGELWRPPEMVAIYAADGRGVEKSQHPKRLAVDLNLFLRPVHGGSLVYQTDSAAYEPLGDFWEAQHELCRWGGRFTKKLPSGLVVPDPDGNHFEVMG